MSPKDFPAICVDTIELAIDTIKRPALTFGREDRYKSLAERITQAHSIMVEGPHPMRPEVGMVVSNVMFATEATLDGDDKRCRAFIIAIRALLPLVQDCTEQALRYAARGASTSDHDFKPR